MELRPQEEGEACEYALKVEGWVMLLKLPFVQFSWDSHWYLPQGEKKITSLLLGLGFLRKQHF